MEKNRHHIIHPRRPHTIYEESKQLRNSRLLIPRLDKDIHEELHQNCPEVPLLGYVALKRTLIAFNSTFAHSSLEAVDNLQFSIDRATKHEGYVQRELGELAIYSLDMQKQYLEEEWDGAA